MKRSKTVYILGSVIIGVIALLIIFFVLIASGVIDPTQHKVVFSSSSAVFTYDGKPHSATRWELTDGTLKEGHTAKVTVTGRQTDVGTSDNYISAVIVDSNGADVTDRYEIEYQVGKIRVKPLAITLTSENKSKVYDGTPLYGWTEEGTCTLADGVLVAGHTLKAAYSSSLTDVGVAPNSFTATIFDSNGNDKTSNYNITYNYGTLEVLKRKMLILSSDGEKEYDGTPLTNTGYRYSDGVLIEGQTLEVSVDGSQTEAGQSDNTFTAVINDENGKDVSGNYDITATYGTLTVKKRKLTLTSATAEKEYDGEPLTANTCTSPDAFPTSQNLSVTITGSITEAGKVNNEFDVSITDAEGNDVSKNYEVTKVYGMLTVKKRAITLESKGAEKVYDGTPLTVWEAKLTKGELLPQHEWGVTFTGTITNAGKVPNTFSVNAITDPSGVDLKDNYEITYAYGDLVVLPIEVAFETLSYHWIYDGEEHSYPHWRWPYADDELPEILKNLTVDINMPATIVNAETCANYYTDFKLLDADGNDVTNNFKITFDIGNLYVTQRPITVRSGNAEKVYDGSPLTCQEYSVVSNYNVVAGHTIECQITGEQTDPGESDNKIFEVIVRDFAGKDVSYNYEITRDEGVLRVLQATAPEKGNNNLDESGSLGGTPNSNLAAKVRSQKSGTLYLRYKSFGEYTGQKWEEATPYGEIEGYSPNYIASEALFNAGYNDFLVTVDAYGSNYLLPYYISKDDCLYEKQTSDIIYTGDTSNPYSCYCFMYDYVNDGAIPAGLINLGVYSEAEKSYYDFVKSNYLSVDLETLDYMTRLKAAESFNAQDPNIIERIANYIKVSAIYNLNYPKDLDSSSNPVVEFLSRYQTGVCRHYASAATLLYRSLGIPARYVIGYKCSAVAGEEVEVTGNDAHAWVEVYIQGFGWVHVEVTGGSGGSSGSYDEEEEKGVVKPRTEYYRYDTLIHKHSGILQGLSGLEEGYTYEAKVSGSGKNPGKYVCKITSLKILYNGEDVTSSYLADHDLVVKDGMMQIYLQELTISTGSGVKEYDGTPLVNDEISYTGLLVDGHELIGQVTGSIINVGVANNTYTVKIYTESGQDVTDYYRIRSEFGTLRVTHRPLTIKAADATKEFDNKPLTANTAESFTILSGELVDGHTITVKIWGSQTNIGESRNKITDVYIEDGLGRDVTRNYSIVTINGTLTVTVPGQS